MTDPANQGADAARVRPAPPEGQRWQKGQSGNPAGGPKRPAFRTAEIEWVFSQEFTVHLDDAPQKLPLARALLMLMAHKALKGDLKAAGDLLKLMGEAEATRAAEAAARARKAAEHRDRREARMHAFMRMADKGPADFDAYRDIVAKSDDDAATEQTMTLLDVAAENDDGRWRVKPWVLEAALRVHPDLLDALTPDERDVIDRALLTAVGQSP